MNPESPDQLQSKGHPEKPNRNVKQDHEGHITTSAVAVPSTEVARNLAVSPRKSSPSKLSPRKNRSGTKMANQKS